MHFHFVEDYGSVFSSRLSRQTACERIRTIWLSSEPRDENRAPRNKKFGKNNPSEEHGLLGDLNRCHLSVKIVYMPFQWTKIVWKRVFIFPIVWVNSVVWEENVRWQKLFRRSLSVWKPILNVCNIVILNKVLKSEHSIIFVKIEFFTHRKKIHRGCHIIETRWLNRLIVYNDATNH